MAVANKISEDDTNVPNLDENFAPNFFNGSITLLKSLFDKLESPLIVISFFEWTKRPKMSLPSVPEFPESKIIFFLYLKPFKPLPVISQEFFESLYLIPSFFKHFKVFITSSDLKRFKQVDFPLAWEANKAHLIDKLLSPSIFIDLLKGLIELEILIKLLTDAV